MAGDKYKNFLDLSQNHEQDVDYRIDLQDYASPFTVIAIHGGYIEWTTSEIARTIAGDDFNCYLFEGLKRDSWQLHLTSNNFDEPSAIELLRKSQTCVSIHGFKEAHKKQVCIGGLNTRLKKIILDNLLQTGLIEQKSENPLDKFYGSDKKNIVNRCTENGVQIEISRALRDLLRNHPDKMKLFAAAIRKSFFDYNQSRSPTPPPEKPPAPL